MSNQEQKNQEETNKEAGVEKRRRFIKGAGIAAPVVLTLSSPSVFGIQCGSEIISGNESQNNAQGSCQPGLSPDTWKLPANKGLWPEPYKYSAGTDPAIPNCMNFTGGTLFDTAFPTNVLTGKDDPNGTSTNPRSMRVILCAAQPADELKRILIAALLNAAIIPNTYPLNADDVKAIVAGTMGIPTNPGQIPAIGMQVMEYFNLTW